MCVKPPKGCSTHISNPSTGPAHRDGPLFRHPEPGSKGPGCPGLSSGGRPWRKAQLRLPPPPRAARSESAGEKMKGRLAMLSGPGPGGGTGRSAGARW